MELTDRVTKLEDEVKIVKNEVQAVLLDIRESYLNRENPFNPDAAGGVTTLNATIGLTAPSVQEPRKPPASALPPEPEEPEPLPKLPALDEPIEEIEEVATAKKEETAEEVNEAARSEEEPEDNDMRETPEKKNGQAKKNGKMDMATIAGLTKWVSGAAGTFGRERTETVLDFAELAGHLSPEIKNTLVKFVSRAPVNGHGNNGHNDTAAVGSGNGNGHAIKAGQLVASLIEFEGLLGMQSGSDELTLLAMVCQEVDK